MLIATALSNVVVVIGDAEDVLMATMATAMKNISLLQPCRPDAAATRAEVGVVVDMAVGALAVTAVSSACLALD